MSISENARRRYDDAVPATDEGWWQAVLADEQRYAPPQPQHAAMSKPKPVSQERQSEKSAVVQTAEPTQADWEAIKTLYSNDRIVEMKVVGHNRGGLLVESEGLSGFVPFSHLIDLAGKEHDADREISLETYQGKMLSVKVIECIPEDGRVVFSERAALAEPGKRAEIFHNLTTGKRVQGTVTNITDFGVFVDLGGVEGLIHISELSWGRVSHPNQIVKLGEQIDIQVLDISAERCRVALSLKRMTRNPWERATADFPEGAVLSAIVTSVLSYGVFARIDAGVEGLIHASEMSLDAGQSPRDLFREGQDVQVRVLHVDPSHQRMGLTLKTN